MVAHSQSKRGTTDVRPRPIAPSHRSKCSGAAIADAAGVHSETAGHTVDVVHNIEPDEWYVTVDGRRVLTFSGPSAWTMALNQQAELDQLLADDSTSAAKPRS